MLKFYDALGRLANMLARPLFPLFSRRTRVRALVLSEDNTILLTRSWLGFQRWSLPGGGIKTAESAEIAAAREVFEETGVLIGPSAFVRLGEFANTDSHAPFTVVCVVARTAQTPTHVAWWRRYEILESAWFSLEKLPTPHSQNIDLVLAKLHAQK